jgi:hypothetical protein
MNIVKTLTKPSGNTEFLEIEQPNLTVDSLNHGLYTCYGKASVEAKTGEPGEDMESVKQAVSSLSNGQLPADYAQVIIKEKQRADKRIHSSACLQASDLKNVLYELRNSNTPTDFEDVVSSEKDRVVNYLTPTVKITAKHLKAIVAELKVENTPEDYPVATLKEKSRPRKTSKPEIS